MAYRIYGKRLAFVILLSAIICVTCALQDKIVLYVPPDHVASMMQAASTCGAQYGVDPSAVQLMFNWTLPDDTPYKLFLYCVCLENGYIDTEGHFILGRLLEYVHVNGTREEYKRNLEECNKITLKNPLDTTYALGVCLHAHHILIPVQC